MVNVEEYLQTHQISYMLHEHPAVNTCVELDKYIGSISGLSCKNLLLKDQKGKRYFLFVLPSSKKADLKKFCGQVGENKVSFAGAQTLLEKLGIEPGAVSPFGLLNDINKEVELFIDEEVYHAVAVCFHPNRNTASLELTREMFHKFLQTIDHNIKIFK